MADSHPTRVQTLHRQSHVTPIMRSILVEWLWEVCKSFKLHSDTFFKCVVLLDAYLRKTSEQIVRADLQLVGIAALFVASKLEEIYAPEVRDFVFICDKAYTASRVLEAELKLVNELEWKLHVPYLRPRSPAEEYAAVIMAIDGQLSLRPINRRLRASLRGISKRLRTKTPMSRAVSTRQCSATHDPLQIFDSSRMRLDNVQRFYESQRMLQ